MSRSLQGGSSRRILIERKVGLDVTGENESIDLILYLTVVYHNVQEFGTLNKADEEGVMQPVSYSQKLQTEAKLQLTNQDHLL
jgi:hypothetical protein